MRYVRRGGVWVVNILKNGWKLKTSVLRSPPKKSQSMLVQIYMPVWHCLLNCFLSKPNKCQGCSFLPVWKKNVSTPRAIGVCWPARLEHFLDANLFTKISFFFVKFMSWQMSEQGTPYAVLLCVRVAFCQTNSTFFFAQTATKDSSGRPYWRSIVFVCVSYQTTSILSYIQVVTDMFTLLSKLVFGR